MFTPFQIISITLFTAIVSYDTMHTQLMNYGRLVFCGLVVGMIMGNVPEGLLIGGTMELMSLGVGGFGGAAIPNYMLGAIIGIAFAAVSGGGMEAGLAVGIPVAALGVQLDVFSRMISSFFLHKAQSSLEKMDLKNMYRWIFAGMWPRILFLMLIVFLALTAGSSVIVSLLALMPPWLSQGLNIAGGVLPALGFAILLKYLPLTKYFIYAMLGFLLSSYFSMPIIGVASFGFIVAYVIYTQNEREAKANPLESINGIEVVHDRIVLVKKDVLRARNRWMTTNQVCFNYESMQAASVVYAVGPSLEKIYLGHPDELQNSLRAHFRFFNTQPWMANLILSSALAVEENGGENAIEAASTIRTSLMGPFAGLGDSILTVLPKTIFGAIAAYMAIEGNATGVLMCLILGLIMVAFRIKLWDLGYKQGVKFVTSSQSRLKSITDAASVMGLVVVGALIASNVKVSVPVVFTIGESVTKLQDIFNKIMPNMLPLLVVIVTYWALGKKKMTSAKMV
ncbi:MAG: PTS system mannose/fructose/sorbose family transporter subunit IID, partial [Erysipelotrichaceae bacterium]